MLGNQKPVKKVKQAKEFANGSLEAKPNHNFESKQNQKYKDDVMDITAQVEQPSTDNQDLVMPKQEQDAAPAEETPAQSEEELNPAHNAEGEE